MLLLDMKCRGTTAKERHSLSSLKLLTYAEQIELQVRWYREFPTVGTSKYHA